MDRASMTQTRTCNLHCQLTWNVVSRGACSSDCGPGYSIMNIILSYYWCFCGRYREVTYNCMKVDVTKEAYEAYTSEAVNSHTEIVDERWCSNVLSKPTLMETCTGLCHSTRWKYEQWTQVCVQFIKFRIEFNCWIVVFENVRRRHAAAYRQMCGQQRTGNRRGQLSWAKNHRKNLQHRTLSLLEPQRLDTGKT